MFPESNGIDLELAQSMQQAGKLKDIFILLSALGSRYFPEYGLQAIKENLLPIKDILDPNNSGVMITLPIFYLYSKGLSVSFNVSIVNKV